MGVEKKKDVKTIVGNNYANCKKSCGPPYGGGEDD